MHVVVIGGGVAGCVSALELASRGHRVTLLEKNPFLLSETSAANNYRLGIGPHYCGDEQTAIKNLRATITFLRRYSDFISSKDKPQSHPHRRGRYFVDVNSQVKTLELNPNHVGAQHYAAIISNKLEKYQRSLTHFKKLCELEPENPAYMFEVGILYNMLKEPFKAMEHFESALKKFPKETQLMEPLIFACKNICEWEKEKYWTNYFLELKEECLSKGQLFHADNFIYFKISAAEKLFFAQMMTKQLLKKHEDLLSGFQFNFTRESKPKLRIGYVSADIRNHAVSHLIRNMFAYHNKERFEIFLYSMGANEKDNEYRMHIANLCDHFIDVFENSSRQIIERIHRDKIDILIDLMGYTGRSRTEIFAAKPAPIQINYLGFPGTMGADFMDYIIADKTSIPLEHQQNYSEKIIYMPYTYFVTDNEVVISKEECKRSDFNLPENGFVFCSFNRPNKFDSEVFDSWMRILQQVPNSVLWLHIRQEKIKENLIKEAQLRGVEKSRLIFADSLSKEKHLARLKLADLFLDCFVYGAHTTAIDALWAGLPLITRLGDSITSRATGGILNAMGLPELITSTTEDFEQLAVFYATHPEKLRELREKVARNRMTTPLFNTKQYVGWFEQGLENAWGLYLDGKEAQTYVVPARMPGSSA